MLGPPSTSVLTLTTSVRATPVISPKMTTAQKRELQAVLDKRYPLPAQAAASVGRGVQPNK